MSTAPSSDNLPAMLAAAEARAGLPKGAMASVLAQETGGNTKFLEDPTAYHYAPGPDGRRVAPHTGQVSTAFGPFGILESTASKPGYGVEPLKDKSLGEQIRFAADYLAARVKSAGGLEAGLASYGEGPKYAKQVVSRMGKGGEPPGLQPQAVASGAAPAVSRPDTPVSAPVDVPPQVLAAVVMPETVGGTPPSGLGGDAWQEFLNKMPRQAAPIQVADLDFTRLKTPNFSLPPKNLAGMGSRQPNFAAFSAWKGNTA